MATIKVMPWGKGQGDYVLIDEESFDSSIHKPYSPAEPVKPKKQGGKKTDTAEKAPE